VSTYLISSDKRDLTITSYHHLLKSKWLDGKRNWRIDHLIFILTQRVLPNYYQPRHQRQQVGLEGFNLQEKQWLTILGHAKSISARDITRLSETTFHVESQSCPGQLYLVDTWAAICECPEFPRIRLCKHLATVQGYPTDIPPSGPSRSAANRAPESSGSDRLPNRDRLSPNANLWKETEDKIYHRISPKKALHNSTTEHIGPTGKCKIVFNDPYCGREQSGKCAKIDAISAAANARAHALACSIVPNVPNV